jgi:MarC family membrane protein
LAASGCQALFFLQALHGAFYRMNHDFASALILLLLVLDPLGGLPIFISIFKDVPPQRRRWVALRESAIAMAVLMIFMVMGNQILHLMRLSERSLEVAGGVILLMVAIRMIFLNPSEATSQTHAPREPFIFPLAIPLMAGPSALATVLLLASRQPDRIWQWTGALVCAVIICLVVLLSASWLNKVLGESVLTAMEKLMGLVLTAIAVEMILAGLKHYFFNS